MLSSQCGWVINPPALPISAAYKFSDPTFPPKVPPSRLLRRLVLSVALAVVGPLPRLPGWVALTPVSGVSPRLFLSLVILDSYGEPIDLNRRRRVCG